VPAYRPFWTLPLNWLSFITGKLAYFKLPGILQKELNRRFALFFGIDIKESELPPEKYSSIGEFFTRKLKPGLRPAGNGETLSPADGKIIASGSLEGPDRILGVIKNRKMTLKALTGDLIQESRFKKGAYFIIYLSPKDYHRFHAPCDLNIVDAYHISGGFWPVNKKSVKNIENLFCINDRVVLVCENMNKQKLYFIAVGATVVGKIKFVFENIRELGGHKKSTDNKYLCFLLLVAAMHALPLLKSNYFFLLFFNCACAAANLAIGTLKGEQLT